MGDFLVKKKELPAEEDINRLVSYYGKGRLSPFIATLLLQRGIDTPEKIRLFFRPLFDDLHNPFLLSGMEAAITKLYETVVLSSGKVLFYGDYDVDGVTSVAMAYSFFSGIYGKDRFGWYIPDRYGEGYGVSKKGIDYAHGEGYNLIVTFDCGINAVEQVEYAKTKGIEMIITDHHNPQDTVPDAIAVIDPKKPDDEYPYKELSGCAVGFKLLQAYCHKANIGFSNLYKYIDLVAVSIASDIVPITGENRILCQFGLDKLNHNPNKGLKELIRYSHLSDKEITVENIVFGLGPRLNSSGRLEHAEISLNLLVTGNGEYAAKLNELNEERKNIEAGVVKEITERYDKRSDDFNAVVVAGKDWHKGVIGIVASKIVDRFYRPAIIFTEEDGKLSGSGRTIPGFNIFEAVKKCAHCLEKFGGHDFAAGMVLKDGCFDEFAECFEKVAAEVFGGKRPLPELAYDKEVFDFSELDFKLYNIIKEFAPFGPGNHKPLFFIDGVTMFEKYSRTVGADGSHLKLFLTDRNNNRMGAIAFGQGEMYEKMKGRRFGLCFRLDKNEYNGKVSLQLQIKQIVL